MAASTIPRWKTAITNALAEHEGSVVIQLASIDPTTPVPHVRSHIFREFISPASTPSLPLLVTSTDIRTPKTAQIISNPHVQVAWWIEGTQEQFRISGLASVIPTPKHSLYKHFVHSVKHAAPGSSIAELAKENFDWEDKRMFQEHDWKVERKRRRNGLRGWRSLARMPMKRPGRTGRLRWEISRCLSSIPLRWITWNSASCPIAGQGSGEPAMDHGIQRRLCLDSTSMISARQVSTFASTTDIFAQIAPDNYAFDFRTFRPHAPAMKPITLQQFIQIRFYSVQPEQDEKGIKNNEQ